MCLLGIHLSRKGTVVPLTREVRVSRDVVFDELNRWYGGKKVMHVDEEKEDKKVKEVQQELIVLLRRLLQRLTHGRVG